MARKKLVILTGAGISAESGIKTFRDSDGLWEEYRIEDVATPEAWERNPELVQEFYNERRRQLYKAEPNAGHRAIAEAERWIDVEVITQNVDNLHERAGSTHVLHLHGLLTQARSSRNPDLIYDIEGTELKMGELAEDGTQLRPHIVWFVEAVPSLEPAAGLIAYTREDIPLFLVDPKPVSAPVRRHIEYIQEPASTGVPKLLERIKALENGK